MSQILDAIATLESLIDGEPDEGIGELLQPILELLQQIPEKVFVEYLYNCDCETCGADNVDCVYLDSESDRNSTAGGNTLCVCLNCLRNEKQELPIKD